jgi:hypothetical protein
VPHKAKTTQQSVRPTLGILARFQAFFYASAFFQSDGGSQRHKFTKCTVEKKIKDRYKCP